MCACFSFGKCRWFVFYDRIEHDKIITIILIMLIMTSHRNGPILACVRVCMERNEMRANTSSYVKYLDCSCAQERKESSNNNLFYYFRNKWVRVVVCTVRQLVEGNRSSNARNENIEFDRNGYLWMNKYLACAHDCVSMPLLLYSQHKKRNLNL